MLQAAMQSRLDSQRQDSQRQDRQTADQLSGLELDGEIDVVRQRMARLSMLQQQRRAKSQLTTM